LLFVEPFVNRLATAFTLTLVLVFSALQVARADDEPLLWSDGTITYRDWGLYRPGVPVLVEKPFSGGYRFDGIVTKNEGAHYYPSVTTTDPAPYYPGVDRDYYPSNHQDPNAYKMKPKIRPVQAEPYYREWGTGSDPAPAPAGDPQSMQPPIMVSPEINMDGRGRR
jgi:hypothetical protein